MVREKDTRVIIRGVTLADQAPQKTLTKGEKKPNLVQRTYGTGDEDALERRLSVEQILDLKARGAIDGNWIAGGEKAQESSQKPQDKSAPADAPKPRAEAAEHGHGKDKR